MNVQILHHVIDPLTLLCDCNVYSVGSEVACKQGNNFIASVTAVFNCNMKNSVKRIATPKNSAFLTNEHKSSIRNLLSGETLKNERLGAIEDNIHVRMGNKLDGIKYVIYRVPSIHNTNIMVCTSSSLHYWGWTHGIEVFLDGMPINTYIGLTTQQPSLVIDIVDRFIPMI